MLDDNGVPVLMDLGSVNTARVEIKTRTEAQALQVTLNVFEVPDYEFIDYQLTVNRLGARWPDG